MRWMGSSPLTASALRSIPWHATKADWHDCTATVQDLCNPHHMCIVQSSRPLSKWHGSLATTSNLTDLAA